MPLDNCDVWASGWYVYRYVLVCVHSLCDGACLCYVYRCVSVCVNACVLHTLCIDRDCICVNARVLVFVYVRM